MNMNKYLDIAPEVQQALADGRPVVALESTIISHGMPYPKNVETALLVEQTLRDNGAVPATIAIIGGRLKAGLTPEEVPVRGGTDGAMLSWKGLPCPNLGTGGFNFHGVCECITAERMDRCTEILLNIIKLYAE